jgi:hypothetical protein
MACAQSSRQQTNMLSTAALFLGAASLVAAQGTPTYSPVRL